MDPDSTWDLRVFSAAESLLANERCILLAFRVMLQSQLGDHRDILETAANSVAALAASQGQCEHHLELLLRIL